jgi:hypothetical protein
MLPDVRQKVINIPPDVGMGCLDPRNYLNRINIEEYPIRLLVPGE